MTSYHDISVENGLNISTIDQNFKTLMSSCGFPIQFNDACNNYLSTEIQQVDDLLAESAILLKRYKVMIHQPNWYESLPHIAHNGIKFSTLTIGHKVLMLDAWRETEKGNINSANEMLNQDSVFWRNAMFSSHTLISLMIIKSIIEENYQWGGFMLYHFSTDNAEMVIPNEWQRPIVEDTFSFKNIVAGEWQVASNIFRDAANSDEWHNIFIRPLFKVQNTINLHAEILSEDSLLKHSDKSTYTTKNCDQKLSFSKLRWYSYNPIGKILICIGKPSLKDYQNRIKEIEIIRQETLALFKE
jgi:hypothetical protein